MRHRVERAANVGVLPMGARITESSSAQDARNGATTVSATIHAARRVQDGVTRSARLS